MPRMLAAGSMPHRNERGRSVGLLGWYTSRAAIVAVILLPVVTVAAHPQGGTLADYARAEAFMSLDAKVVGVTATTPQWIGSSDRFWYRVTRSRGHEFVLVDAERNTSQPAFDHARLADGIAAELGGRHVADSLSLSMLDLRPDERVLRARVAGRDIACDLVEYVCRVETSVVRPGEIISPDGRWAAFVRDFNLYVRALDSSAEIQLTHDGIASFGYGYTTESSLLSVSRARAGQPDPARVLWSPDSQKLLSYRVDERLVPELPFIDMAPGGRYNVRPKLYTARVAFPADSVTATAELVVFDVPSGRRIDVRDEPLYVNYDLIRFNLLRWSKTGKTVFYFREERGFHRIQLYAADASTGQVRRLVEERSTSYFWPGFHQGQWGVAGEGEEVIWPSDRDGWFHLYRYDDRAGQVARQLTSGAWRAKELQHVDAAGRWVYFLGNGREPGRDPYYSHLYRLRFDGTALQLLTPENGHHQVTFSPSGRYFIDRYSRTDLPPITVLRTRDGKLVRELERANIGALLAAGWRVPERFHAKGRDGTTDIYGVLYRPANFDSTKRYPVIDFIYGGPQSIHAPRMFTAGEAIAELGFLVVRIDGMGTPGRSKAFQELSYGAGFAEGGGLEDHIAVLKALATRYPYLDLSRVGIYGHSGGGYSSARALFDYPDFFKVAVSSAGSHDQYLYQLEWGERFIGRPGDDPAAYALQANSGRVANLRGKLLLAHGDMDDDVHLVNTMQLVHALVVANKDFDLMILPGRNHSTMASDRYFVRRRWDYFVRHLLGVEPPPEYKIGR